MTASREPSGDTNGAATGAISRKLRILVMVLIGLCVLVTAAWFAGARLYTAALDQGRSALERDAITVACTDERLVGFPARFEVRCAELSVSQANSSSLSGGALTTVAPAWNPLLTIVEWAGPFAVRTDGGVVSDIETDLLRASVRVDTAGALQRLSAVLQSFAVRMDGAPLAIAGGDGLEVHMRPADGEASDAADIEASALVFGLSSPFLIAAETVDFSIGAVLDDLALARGVDALSILTDWVSRSGRFESAALRLRLDDHAINLDGMGQIDPSGVLDFTGTIATNDVGALVELFGVTDAGTVAAISAGAGLFGRQTTIGEDAATELPLTIESGSISVGPARVGTLPPLLPPG
ncbi:MAG: DUF2125 domain-containing protein [Pseudomonadota bacterium]